MFSKVDETTNNTYRFKFQEPTNLDQIATICVIGCEHRTQENQYHWDCQSRTDTETFIFQYTLSGKGEINIKGEVHQLLEGHAFMISVPENCQYYLPSSSKEWKFIFITLAGVQAKQCWEYINSHYGYVFKIPIEAMLIQRLISTYISVVEGKIIDAYRASSKAFEFLTYCYRQFEKNCITEVAEMPQDISKAIDFIKKNYYTVISVEEISDHVGLSKSYLNKKFKAYTHLPPINYLNSYRIEKSLYLLQHTKKSVKEIALELGFSNPNYFCKVFRKATGISPSMFKKVKTSQDKFDFLITNHHGIIELD